MVQLFIISFCSISAQDYKTDFEKCKNFYVTSTLYMEVNSFAYSFENKSKAVNYGSGLMYKNNNINYSKFGDNELLVDSKYMIHVDHKTKEIFVRSRNKYKADKNNPINFIDSTMKNKDSVVFLNKTPGSINYVIFSKDKLFSRTVVSFDEKNFYLKRIEFYYNQRIDENYDSEIYKLVVDYKVVKKEIPENLIQIGASQFVKKSGNKFLPSNKFKNYSLEIIDRV